MSTLVTEMSQHDASPGRELAPLRRENGQDGEAAAEGWQRLDATNTLEPGYYWRATTASQAADAGDVLLLVELNEFDGRLHSVELLCHPSRGTHRHTLLVEEFLAAFEPAADGEQVRATEQQAVMQRVTQLQAELVAVQADPRRMIEVVRDKVEADLAEQDRASSESAGSDPERARRERDLSKLHRRAARRSAANGNPLALPKAVLSSSVADVISQGIDGAGVEQMAHLAQRHAIVAQAQADWLGGKTREIASAVQSLTPYMAERSAVALARASGAITTAKRITEGIRSLALYTGEGVDVFDVRTGPTAPPHEPLTLLQGKRYMNEELAAWADVGEDFDYTDKESFFQALASDDQLLDQVLPAPRCVVTMAVRRHARDYGENALANALANAQNLLVFLLVRNGANVHVVYSSEPSHEAAKRLFPTEDELSRPFTGFDGERLSVKDVAFAKGLQEFELIALAYKRFLILLCGLDHRLKLFGDFYPSELQMGFMSAAFQQRYFRFVFDDETSLQLGEPLPSLSDWIAQHNLALQSGSRVFALESSAKAAAPEVMRRHQIKVDGEQFQRPFIATKEGAKVGIRLLCRDGRETFHARCDLFHKMEYAHAWWLCVDAVDVRDVQRYRHSRVHRSMGIHYLRLFRRLEAFLLAEQAAEAAARDYLLRTSIELGGLTEQEATGALQTAVRNWRAARRGAPLPTLPDGQAELNEVLTLMVPAGRLGGEAERFLESYLREQPVRPLLLTRTGRDKLYLYCEATPEDRAPYPSVLQWGWVRRITLTTGKTKLRELARTLVWLREALPAEQTEVRRWDGLQDWLHKEPEPVDLRRAAQVLPRLQEAMVWAPVLRAGAGSGIPAELFEAVLASTQTLRAKQQGRWVATVHLALPVAVYAQKAELKVAYLWQDAYRILYVYGDEAQRARVLAAYCRPYEGKAAAANRLRATGFEWQLGSDSAALERGWQDLLVNDAPEREVPWAYRKVKGNTDRRYGSSQAAALSLNRAFDELLGVSGRVLRRRFYEQVREDIRSAKRFPAWRGEPSDVRSKVAALAAKRWAPAYRAQASALIWSEQQQRSIANAFFVAPLRRTAAPAETSPQAPKPAGEEST